MIRTFILPFFFDIMNQKIEFFIYLTMETIEYFSDFLRKTGIPNFLAIGIVIVLVWLLISGIRRGLRKGDRNKDANESHSKD